MLFCSEKLKFSGLKCGSTFFGQDMHQPLQCFGNNLKFYRLIVFLRCSAAVNQENFKYCFSFLHDLKHFIRWKIHYTIIRIISIDRHQVTLATCFKTMSSKIEDCIDARIQKFCKQFQCISHFTQPQISQRYYLQ